MEPSLEDLPVVLFSEDLQEWTLPTGAARPKKPVGPIRANVQHVHDGDTLKVKIPGWPTVVQFMLVRLFGTDTPELHDPRPEIVKLALEAKKFTQDCVQRAHDECVLLDAAGDKYFRLLAKIELPKVGLLGELLEREGLGRPYFGVNPKPWDRGV